MTKQITQKYNESCIKLFEFLKMLYEGDVEFKKVIDHFSEGSYDGTSNTHVTLNKFLNALKIFGINVKKIKHHYTIQSPIYKMNFNNEDLKSFCILDEACKELPDGKTKKKFESFLRSLKIRFDGKTLNNLEAIESDLSLNREFPNSEMVTQVKKCKKYCDEGFKLEIVYINDDGDKINLLCSPQEVAFIKRRICLRAIGSNGNRIYEIPIENIKDLKQTSSKNSENSNPTTIAFRVKNRLAKNYRMRDWEHLQQIELDGNKVIINQGEDLDILLARLMKYGRECDVISPKFYKEEMLNRINKTLSNYQ